MNMLVTRARGGVYKLMWRPFVSMFVDNSYEEFLRKYQLRPKRKVEAVEEAVDSTDWIIKLRQVQENLKKRKNLIRLHDKLREKKKKQLEFEAKSLRESEKRAKKLYYLHIRSMAMNAVQRSPKPETQRKVRYIKQSEIFDLTALNAKDKQENKFERAKSQIPPRQTLEEYQEKLLNKVETQESRRKLIEEFKNIRNAKHMTIEEFRKARMPKSKSIFPVLKRRYS